MFLKGIDTMKKQWKDIPYEDKVDVMKELLYHDTIEFSKAFEKFEKAQSGCDKCPLCDLYGTCLPKMLWPRVDKTIIDTVAKWMVFEEEKQC